MQERPDPGPGEGEIRVKVSACGVCRTDLHVVDAELPGIRYPIVPGHEIIGRVDLVGRDVITHRIGDRVGIPWLGYTCGVCRYCREGMENLCDRPLFTGYTRDGGFATHTIADARYAFPLGEHGDDVAMHLLSELVSRSRMKTMGEKCAQHQLDFIRRDSERLFKHGERMIEAHHEPVQQPAEARLRSSSSLPANTISSSSIFCAPIMKSSACLFAAVNRVAAPAADCSTIAASCSESSGVTASLTICVLRSS
jgi:hypothetical protein